MRTSFSEENRVNFCAHLMPAALLLRESGIFAFPLLVIVRGPENDQNYQPRNVTPKTGLLRAATGMFSWPCTHSTPPQCLPPSPHPLDTPQNWATFVSVGWFWIQDNCQFIYMYISFYLFVNVFMILKREIERWKLTRESKGKWMDRVRTST